MSHRTQQRFQQVAFSIPLLHSIPDGRTRLLLLQREASGEPPRFQVPAPKSQIAWIQ